MAQKENVKIKKIDLLQHNLKEITNKYAVNKNEFYRNLSLNTTAKESFADNSRAYTDFT